MKTSKWFFWAVQIFCLLNAVLTFWLHWTKHGEFYLGEAVIFAALSWLVMEVKYMRYPE